MVKNLALMTHVTTDTDEKSLAQLAYNMGVEDFHYLAGDEISHPDVFVVFLNGKLF